MTRLRSRGQGAGGRIRSCRVCGCTEADCTGCIERTGGPCSWVEADLCSACAPAAAVMHRSAVPEHPAERTRCLRFERPEAFV